jgi:hypothetical protein
VDGQEVSVHVSDDSAVARAMIRVPHDPSDLALDHEVVVADAEGWSMAMKFRSDGVEGRCTPATADLRGRTQDRFGLASVVVDDECASLTTAQVSRAIEGYFAVQQHELQQLDSLNQVLRAYESVSAGAPSSPPGSPNVDLDTHRVLGELTSETLRQGVTVLLTVEVRCNGGSYVITGSSIDLRGFTKRARSRITGVDLTGLLDVSTTTVTAAADLRDGLDRVLAGLLGRTVVQLVDAPVVVDYYNPLSVDYRVTRGSREDATKAGELGLVYVEGDHAAMNLCREFDDFARLSHHGTDELVEALDRMIMAPRPARANGSQLLLAERLPFDGDSYASMELALMRPGYYLVWIRTEDNRSISARCFRAVSSRLAFYVQLGGLVLPTLGSGSYLVRVFRLEAGVTYPFGERKLGRVGGLLGYSYAGYVGPPMRTTWTRHGLALGGFIGFDAPVSRCVYRPESWRLSLAEQNRRCADVTKRSWSFAGNFGAGASFGFHEWPATLYQPEHVSHDVDLEIAVQLMLKVQLDVRTSFYFFHRLSVLDVTAGRSDSHSTEFSSVVTLLGAGVAWIVQKR